MTIRLIHALTPTALALLLIDWQTGAAAERGFGPSPYAGPLIDAHSHPRKANREVLGRHFAEVADAGVERVIVMHTPNDYRKPKRVKMLERSRSFSNVTTLCTANFAAFIHVRQLDNSRAAVAGIESSLAAGKCAGIGELAFRHFGKNRRGRQPVVTVPLDHPLVHQVLSLADAYSVPLVLHIEPVNPGDGSNRIVEIKRWYQAVCEAYKNVQLIAAHTGMISPADLEELLLRCPNLHADFKVLHSVRAINGFAHLHGVNDLDFRFFEEWAALMERFPGRFVFGSDWKDQRHGYTKTSYAAHIREMRRIIGSLAPHVQQRIAYTNAKRLFRLP